MKFGIFTAIIGVLSQLLIVKFLIIKTVRIKTRHFKILFDIIESKKGFKMKFKETVEDKSDHLPSILNGIFILDGMFPFVVKNDERMLSAGWVPKDTVTEITIFRWHYNKLKKLLSKVDKDEDNSRIHIYLSNGSSERYLGSLERNRNMEIDSRFKLIEDDIIKIFNNEIKGTSFLLHGPPGNGKTTLIRNIGIKYGFNLYYLDISKTTTNADIISCAAFVPDNTIIMLEDFDSLYDKREVQKFEKPDFSFDAILNLLDGIYNNRKDVIFAITANDISKIDESILNRRGRVKHVVEVGNPSYEKRLSILNDPKSAYESEGLSLDQVYFLLSSK